jgi:hypothetical protein
MITSSVELLQVPLVSVQRKVTLELDGTAVIVVVAEAEDVIDAEPLIIVQTPVPIDGTAAIVNVDVLHKD